MSTEVTIQEAKTNFSKLVREVEAGEVIVRRAKTPVARLSAYSEPAKKEPCKLGGLEGQIWIADDFDDQLAGDFNLAD